VVFEFFEGDAYMEKVQLHQIWRYTYQEPLIPLLTYGWIYRRILTCGRQNMHQRHGKA